MTALRDGSLVRAFLARASRRVALLSATTGVAVGLAVAGLVEVAGPRSTVLESLIGGVVLAAIGAVVALVSSRRRRANVALLVERRAPHCRNLVVTAAELPRQQVPEHIAAHVYTQASRAIERLDLHTLFPARRRALYLVAGMLLWIGGVAQSIVAPVLKSVARRGSSAPAITSVEVTVIPPGYVGGAPQVLRDPARVEAIAGSRIRVAIRANAERLALSTLTTNDTIVATSGTFADTLTADADGYIALEPLAPGEIAGPRRLIGLSVVADESPRVRITTPGRDVYLDSGRATLQVAIETSDDIGLASLKLRYTKVSGSGERFTFTEGEVPIAIARADARSWTARVPWRLDSLALEAGDMVVYRAVAADYRPGATPSESDSFIAEVTAPGGNAAAGFALDPEQERYAVSQQMVILKTQRLLARKTTMPAEEYATASMELAAEQRKVRAEFVFMMGGELADAHDADDDPHMLNEEAEAEGEADLAAGRNLNQGRIYLQRAIRSMSHASQSLTIADLTTALTHEKAALDQLERAFSRTRILLRALTERERLDYTRRLTGNLSDASRDVRPRSVSELDARVVELRRTLSGIATLASSAGAASSASTASMLAERVLRIDASSKPLQGAAALLTSASNAFERGRDSEARELIDRAAVAVTSAVRSELLAAPQPASTRLDQLGGALSDALARRLPGINP